MNSEVILNAGNQHKYFFFWAALEKKCETTKGRENVFDLSRIWTPKLHILSFEMFEWHWDGV